MFTEILSRYPHLIQSLLIVSHIFAGVIGLFVAPVAMAALKGGRVHRVFGRVFYWCMAYIFVSTIGLAFYRFSLFLLVVGVLSFYSAFTGVRALRFKRPGTAATRLDWAVSGVAMLAGAALTGVSAVGMLVPSALGLAPTGVGAVIGLMFGAGLTMDGWRNMRFFHNPAAEKMGWFLLHINQMCGAYIAMVTAFLVNVAGRVLPESVAWVGWVAPSVIGGFAIGIVIRRYRRKFAGTSASAPRALEPAVV